MKIGIVVAAAMLAGCTITLHEDPRVLASLDRISTSIDGLRVAAQPQQPAKHLVCRGKEAMELPADDRKDGDVEMPVKACAAPDDQAPCVNGVPLSNAVARCKAGKLEAGK